MLKRTGFTLFLLLLSIAAYSQNTNDNSLAGDGSYYSRFGVGIPTDFGSSGADGQGLQGVSDNEPLVPNAANPAIWGHTVYALATGGLGISNFNGADNNGTSKHSNVFLNQFQLQLPLYKDKIGVSLSFNPYTRSDFKVRRQRSVLLQNGGGSADSLKFNTENVGSGGVNQFELGVGWKINSNISIGYAASLVHASIDNNFTTNFNNNTSFASVNSTLQTSASGFGNRFGAYFTIPLTSKENQLDIGAVVNLPVTLHGDRIQQSTFVSGDPSDPNANVQRKLASGDIQIPLGVTLGLTYKPSKRVAISTEGRYDKWSDYSNDLKQSSGNISFVNRYKAGAGINFYPYYSGSNKFFSHFKYRFGTSYDTGRLKINGQNINTFMISAGLGILSPNRSSQFNSSVDISFHYGIRGTQANNLVKENIYGFKLSVNLGELFFFRPKLK